HTGHTLGLVPALAPVPWQVGHALEVGTASGTCAPLTAWSKVSDTSVSRSRPRGAARPERTSPCRPPGPRWAPPPLPNRFDKMSEKLPENAPGSKPPPPVPKLNGPVPRSYALRLSESDSTSCACEISLKRSSAFLSPGLRSGWYWRASLR